MQAIVIDEADEDTLKEFITNTVESGATVYADGSHVYNRLEGYEHEKVIHSRGEYVRGDCYTNGIEAFWSMIKPSWACTTRSAGNTSASMSQSLSQGKTCALRIPSNR